MTFDARDPKWIKEFPKTFITLKIEGITERAHYITDAVRKGSVMEFVQLSSQHKLGANPISTSFSMVKDLNQFFGETKAWEVIDEKIRYTIVSPIGFGLYMIFPMCEKLEKLYPPFVTTVNDPIIGSLISVNHPNFSSCIEVLYYLLNYLPVSILDKWYPSLIKCVSPYYARQLRKLFKHEDDEVTGGSQDGQQITTL